jgi:PAS domain S-box-containing protein
MNRIFKIPLNRQVYLTFSVICLVLALIGGVLFFSLLNIERRNHQMQFEVSQKRQLSSDISKNIGLLQAEVFRRVLITNTIGLRDHALVMAAIRQSDAEKLKEYKRLTSHAREQQLYARVLQAREDYWSATDSLLQLSRADQHPEKERFSVSVQAPAYDHYRRAVDELSDSSEKMEQRMASATAGMISRTRIFADDLLGVAMVITVCAGLSVRKMESRLKQDNRDLKAMMAERKSAEAALRESETRLRAIFETEPECVKVVSSEGALLEMNPAGLAMLQACSLAEAQQKALVDFIVPEHRKAFRTLHQQVMRGEPGILEFEVTGLNGGRRWLETHATPLRDSAGAVQSLLGITRDITGRKDIAALNHQLTMQLEARVVERTGELQQVNKELEAFSYSVSHDLRAPLRQITGFVKLLQKDAGPALTEKSLRFLTTVSESAQRMGNLIDDLLAFSQIGRATLQKTVVHLHELTLEAVADFQPEIKAREVKWIIEPLPLVWADRSLLRMVLVNLVSNALKFTSARPAAQIEIGCAPGGPAETVIFIRDNGAGFNPKYIDKLFGVFQRLHSQAEFEGTGIGLANVQRIINRHGGRVWADGVEDGGATFYFSLPKQPGGKNEH